MDTRWVCDYIMTKLQWLYPGQRFGSVASCTHDDCDLEIVMASKGGHAGAGYLIDRQFTGQD